MRKCIDLESQPGFEQIYSPVLQQAIDRGLRGHSGSPDKIDWGYDLPTPQTDPTIRPDRPPRVDPIEVPIDPNMPNPVTSAQGSYWNNQWNRFAIEPIRKLINLFPSPKLVHGSGSYGPFSDTWGKITTPYGYGGSDVATYFHESGHGVDHIGGMIENDSKMPLKETSMELLPGMSVDGNKLGWIVDDRALYTYIEENGLTFNIKGNRDVRISKGSDKAKAESKMRPGDRFRILEYVQKKAKLDLQEATLTKDPVKIAKAKKVSEAINKVFDADTKRQKDAYAFVKQLVALRDKMKKTMPDYDASGAADFIGSFTDIIDALSGGEIYDRSKAENSENPYRLEAYGIHPHGYYSGRQTTSGNVHNHNDDTIMEYRRAEVWAQLFLFYAHNGGKTGNKDMWNLAKKTLPNTTKAFETAILRLMKIPKKTIENSRFHTEGPTRKAPPNVNRGKKANPTSDLWNPELAGGWQTDTAPMHADYNSRGENGVEYRESTAGEVLQELSKTDSEFGLITRLLRRKYFVPHNIKMRKYKLSDGRNYFEMPNGQRWVVTGISVNSYEVPYNVKYDRWGYASAIKNNKKDGKIVFDNFFEMMVSMGEDPRGPASLYNDRLSDEQIEKLDEEWYEKEGQEFASY